MKGRQEEYMALKAYKKAEEIFRQHHGLLRTKQALELGISYSTLADMTKAELLVRESHGLYRLTSLQPLSNPDLVIVSLRIPNAVICLISALNFHNLTTQIPFQVYIGLHRDIKAPRLDYPPINVSYFSQGPYMAGIEAHTIDNVNIRIYDREKTIADCFKFRNKIGEDIALEALKDYLHQSKRDIRKLMEYAAINHVEKSILPYLKGLL